MVSEQLGHRDLTTTLRFYDAWVPKQGQAYADILESKILGRLTAPFPVIREPKSEPAPTSLPDWDAELAELTTEKAGAGGESRTRDLLITNRRAAKPAAPRLS